MSKHGFMYSAGRAWGKMSWQSRVGSAGCVLALGAAAAAIGALWPQPKHPPPPSVVATVAPAPAPQVSPHLIPQPKAPVVEKPKDPNAIPESWEEFRDSARKDDKAIVAQIEKTDWWKNCVSWGVEARKKAQSRKMWALQANLRARSMINGIDLGGVRGKVPEVGMTTCGAYAVMGLPEDVNRTKNAGGERVQHVWRNPRVYAYTHSSMGDGNAPIHSVQY